MFRGERDPELESARPASLLAAAMLRAVGRLEPLAATFSRSVLAQDAELFFQRLDPGRGRDRQKKLLRRRTVALEAAVCWQSCRFA
jgi:hypothetical protein